jgi:hypothetical protein
MPNFLVDLIFRARATGNAGTEQQKDPLESAGSARAIAGSGARGEFAEQWYL